MVEYSKVSVKLSDRQLKKQKIAVENKTEPTLKMNLKMLDGNDLPHELLFTTRLKKKLRNAFNNNISTDLTLSKAQIYKIVQSGGFLGSLMSMSSLLMKVAIPLAKNVSAPLGITAAVSAIDAGIQDKIHVFGRPSSRTLLISNKEMNDIMKIVQALEDSNILLERVTKTIKSEAKISKRGILKQLVSYFRC